MSEPEPLLPREEAAAPAQGAAAPMTAGRLLAARREEAGLHLAALAATLKVPLHKLQALEGDRYDAFKDVVFLRALASSVCRVLKMDAGPVLALLPQSAPVALKDQQGLNTRFKETGSRPEAAGAWGLPISRLTAFAVIALLAAALVMAFVPHNDNTASPEPEFMAEATPPQAAQAPEPAAAVAPQEVPAPPAPAAPVVAATSPASGGSAPAPDMTVAVDPPAPPAAPRTDAPAAAAAAADPLVIQARDQTWVQVRDAQGAVLAERNLQKGERYAAQGSGPWSVVIGRADAADVTVRGQPMDLSAIARSNVARFEVK